MAGFPDRITIVANSTTLCTVKITSTNDTYYYFQNMQI